MIEHIRIYQQPKQNLRSLDEKLLKQKFSETEKSHKHVSIVKRKFP